MNRLYTFLIALTSVVFSSCEKTLHNVHFHGRVLVGCSGKPAKNVPIFIAVDWDTGQGDYDGVGLTTTDNEGYYSLISDVNYQGSLIKYRLGTDDRMPTHTYTVGGEYYPKETYEKDIQMDGTAEGMPVSLHIKNTSPYDANDCIEFGYLPPYHFCGSKVDTVVYYFLQPNWDDKYALTYGYVKNSISTTKHDTIDLKCDTLVHVNIFY